MSDHRQWVELDPSNGSENIKPQDGPSAAAPAQNSAQPAESPAAGGPEDAPDR
ncbi:hypothetical protein [Azospirillum argentinense]|uniref:Uncharacterized protein n=1 Tax=Azospirillum argentinense TaxID=2970906 RepID=A0A5B0KR96_9PROT|nr:hypothetical protein [Azospirillum argentinense]KAA1055202.1 hypothetical protein FH063_005764 [Azospirillum argentinense]